MCVFMYVYVYACIRMDLCMLCMYVIHLVDRAAKLDEVPARILCSRGYVRMSVCKDACMHVFVCVCMYV